MITNELGAAGRRLRASNNRGRTQYIAVAVLLSRFRSSTNRHSEFCHELHPLGSQNTKGTICFRTRAPTRASTEVIKALPHNPPALKPCDYPVTGRSSALAVCIKQRAEKPQ